MASVLTLEWQGKKYEVDIDSVTPREFKTIKTKLGLKAGAFINSFSDLDNIDADAIVALLWLGRKRAGENPEFEEDVPFMELLTALAPAGEPEEAVEAPKAPSSTESPS